MLRTSDPNMQKIFRAMQKYGLIVADNGSDMYITGTFDTRWNNDILNPAFSLLSASDFEVVQLGWKPTVAPGAALAAIAANPSSVVGGQCRRPDRSRLTAAAAGAAVGGPRERKQRGVGAGDRDGSGGRDRRHLRHRDVAGIDVRR